MNEFKLLLIALLVWGTSTLANLPSADDNLDQDVNTINLRVSMLNVTTPGLDLHTRLQLNNIPIAQQTLSDLQLLYNALQGKQVVAPGSLTTLTCARALCFGAGD
jgi:hypothetical protein